MDFFRTVKRNFMSIINHAPIKTIWNKISNIPSIGLHIMNQIPPKVAQFMKDHGSDLIKTVQVVRTPIPSLIDKVGNAITLGKLNEKKREYGYDKFFHLALQLNGNIILEKNQSVNLQYGQLKGEKLDITVPNEMTLGDLIHGVEHISDIWRYNASTNNCQTFVYKVLLANGFFEGGLNGNVKAFVLQEVEQILNKLKLNKTVDHLTDVAGFANLAWQHLTK